METVVFGRLVTEKIIEDVVKIKTPHDNSLKGAMESIDDKIEAILQRGGENFFKIRDTMTKTMFNKFGIFREEKKMQEGLHLIKQMQNQIHEASPHNKDRKLNQALVKFLELEGMLLLAEAVALGALARKESRGSHNRTDYPERDDLNFLEHTLVELKDLKMNVSSKTVKLGRFKLEERVY